MIIGIDVGLGGGFAVQNGLGIELHKMPPTEGDILALLEGFAQMSQNAICFIELVPTGMPGKGAAMVKLNANAAFIRGCIQALKMRMIQVRPALWQQYFGLGKRNTCKSDTEWKNKLKAEAQRRYPALHITLQTADALLILDWARTRDLRNDYTL